MRHRLIVVCAAALPVVSGAITAGWDNVNPGRTFPTPKKVYWRADLSKWPDAFTVEWKDGAEGKVTLEERGGVRGLRIEKANGLGYLAISPKERLSFPEKTELQSFAYVSGEGNDPLYAVGFLRLKGEKSNDYGYFSKLDGRGPGGPKMQFLANTAPGVKERKLCRYLCQADDGGTNVTPVIVVAGDRSVSRWENWGVEDLEGAKEGWREFVKRTAPPDRSGDQQPLDRFEADLAAEPDHVARVERRDGMSVLLVDGREAAPVMFKGLGSRAGKVQFAGRAMIDAGIDIQSLYVRFGNAPGAFGYWTKDGFDVTGAVDSVRTAMRTAPGAKFVLSMSLDAYPEYAAEHPDEVWKLMDGTVVFGHQVHTPFPLPKTMPKGCWPWVSNHSLVWRADVKRHLAAFVAELRRTGLSKRIVGFHLMGYHDAQFAQRHVDFSLPAKAAFRAWQERRYGQVRWDEPPRTLSKNEVLRPGQDDHWIAYHAFLKRAPFEMQEDIARHVKACFGKDVIAVRYCMSAFGGDYCGTYDISDFLDSDAIDAICAQPNYELRTPAMPIASKLPMASFHRHGKLFLNEFDLRTYGAVHGIETELRVLGLSQATDFPMWETTNRKLAGEMISRRMGWWYCDMSGGWFNPPEIARDIAAVAETVRVFGARRDGWRPSAALVIDEDGVLLRNTPACYYHLDEMNSLDRQVALLAESGVPYDTWLMADVLRDPALLKGYRTIAFSTLYSIDAKRRAALAALKGDGRTLVFLSGTGRAGGAEETGFAFAERNPPADHAVVAEKGFDVNMLSGYDTVMIAYHLGRKLGSLFRPRRFEVKEDRGIVPRARFVKDGAVAAAERKFPDWRSVAICEPAGLTPQYFNRLVGESGGYVPVAAGVQVNMNGSFLSVHCVIPGRYTFRLPFACRVRNLRTGKPEPVSDGILPLDLVAGETCWFEFVK